MLYSFDLSSSRQSAMEKLTKQSYFVITGIPKLSLQHRYNFLISKLMYYYETEVFCIWYCFLHFEKLPNLGSSRGGSREN